MMTVMYQLTVIAIIMIVLDAGWLTHLAPTFQKMIAGIQGKPMEVRWVSALAVYILMIAGLWWFVVRNATHWGVAAAEGAALGAVVYGVYDFTNYSTISGWRLPVALADVTWGSLLFATAAGATVALTKG